jgi:hypothetical protein
MWLHTLTMDILHSSYKANRQINSTNPKQVSQMQKQESVERAVARENTETLEAYMRKRSLSWDLKEEGGTS